MWSSLSGSPARNSWASPLLTTSAIFPSARQPGLRQIIVGESVARRYPGARIGKQVRFGRGMWEVVGVFRVGDSAANSEIWADLNQLRGDFERQGGSSSLLVRAEGEAAVAQLT